ncbi:nitrilase-related carbon-nitrogen hydrolase [Sulfurimonas autotrophica]|uniref:Nitrilase/cyanide hydratase and apolipoprotein N-acyltransferase n=1 Tax=Sulfurimonas autotrophica (strain ATCC BAA-671 / DSM 16294 / JCM 11897 / OK10) TaxID=563040 RepID=E0UQV5_SULAO|nr:nitrilase-related carbon-nitrogen hydrolase [Sulfurimonas autotrophica]ADN08836.1 Nitrilase/cyanide hydratase and apolipoprotein N-acyltransferase [Sulfurimonas autotrophica DSM 16294]
MRVTLAQTSPKLNRSNFNDVVAIINAVKQSSDLIVFPELSLSGYLLQDKLFEDAWSLEELTVFEELSKDIDIVIGAALRDGEVFRNVGLYYANGKFISKHIKVHLPNYGMFEEARYFEGGNKFEAFTVNNKTIAMLVCEDLWHKSVHKELMALNPDLIIVLVASPARGFNDKSLEIQEKWYKIITDVAKECNSQLLFVNRVGFEDGLGFWGGSCVVDIYGKITHKLPLFQKDIQTFTIEE